MFLKILFLYFLFLFCLLPSVIAQSSILDKKINLSQKEGTLENLLHELGEKGEIVFSYNIQEVSPDKKVTLKGNEETLAEYLSTLFGDKEYEFIVRENKVIIKKKTAASSSTSFTINGYVKDEQTGEDLIGATLFVPQTGQGTVSNLYGFYSLSLPEGTYTLVYSYVGYRTITRTIDLNKNLSEPVRLMPLETTLEEVTVSAEEAENKVQNIRMGAHGLKIEAIRQMPTLGGEVDVMRVLQLLPGVNKGSEGSTGLYVRGGNIDQNMIILDEAPVYNPSHLLGVFSVFNPDALKDVQLYKAGIPAEYGGRLSSVLDVRMKEGNSKKFHASGGIGLLASRLTLEGPILKDRTSFILSALVLSMALLLPGLI